MKVMISQPMNGRKNEDIERRRQEIVKKFAKLHIDVENTLFNEEVNNEAYNHPAMYYIAKSIDAIGKVDAVYFTKDWREARGCRIERMICSEYGIKILDEDFLYPELTKTRLYADNDYIGSIIQVDEQKPYGLTMPKTVHNNIDMNGLDNPKEI